MAGSYSRLDLLEMRTLNRLIRAVQAGNRRVPWFGKALVVAVAVVVVVADPFESAIAALEVESDTDQAPG